MPSIDDYLRGKQTDLTQPLTLQVPNSTDIAAFSGIPVKGDLFTSTMTTQNFSDAREVKNDGSVAPEKPDMRLRLRAQTTQESQVYGNVDPANNLLSILYETNGFLFPYTPSIDWSQSVEYQQMSFVHSNQDQYSYKNTPSTQIRITAEFTVQNQREGQYMLAVFHLLRTVSKMYFGKNSSKAGLPPPVMILQGYGNYMFNELPVIVKDHSYSLGKDIDYIDVYTAQGWARLPSLIAISLTLIVQQTPKKLREEFDLDKFRTGELMRTKKGWI